MDNVELESISYGFRTMKGRALILIRYFEIYRDNSNEIFYHLKNNGLIEDSEYYRFIDSISGLIEQLNIVCADIDNVLEDIENTELHDVSSNYKNFLVNEITNFNWNEMSYLDDYSIGIVIDFIKKLDKEHIAYNNQDHNALRVLQSIINYYRQYISTLQNKMSSVKIFDKIRDITGTIVLIGANGSGKSTFARNLKGKLSDNTTILSAQHLLIYSNPEMVSKNNKELNSVYNFQHNDKLGNDPNLINFFRNDMDNLVSALLKENADIDVECNKALRNIENGKKDSIPRRISTLQKVINIWESLVINRKLDYTSDNIEVLTMGRERYDFNCLSDGEKAIFYYTAHVLLAKNNSYIIVDEPNTHLHPAICNKLWNMLEYERSDCNFIYITHDLDFATSRNNKVLLWNKNFEPPYTWNVEKLNHDECIPERLLMEIVGSKEKILFCEGDDRTSIDFRLYSALFKNYTIVPVGGHLNVINYCRAYNRNKHIYGREAIGIIDADCHSMEQIEKWEEDKIYTLRVNEIENLLCDEIILINAQNQFCSGDNAVELFKDNFFRELEKDKEKQAVWYAKSIVNNILKNNMLKENRDLDALESELEELTNKTLIRDNYNRRLNELNDIITNRDYDNALAICNFKGKLTGYIAQGIVNGYKDRVLTLIANSENLQLEIKLKHFRMIQ